MVIYILFVISIILTIINIIIFIKTIQNNKIIESKKINNKDEKRINNSLQLKSKIQSIAICSLHVFSLEKRLFSSENELNEILIDNVCEKLSELDNSDIINQINYLNNDELERFILDCFNNEIIIRNKQKLIISNSSNFQTNENKPPKNYNHNSKQFKDISSELNNIINNEIE